MPSIMLNVIQNTKLWPFVIHICFKRSQFWIMNDKKGHNIVNNIINDIVNNKKGHNFVNGIGQLCL